MIREVEELMLQKQSFAVLYNSLLLNKKNKYSLYNKWWLGVKLLTFMLAIWQCLFL